MKRTCLKMLVFLLVLMMMVAACTPSAPEADGPASGEPGESDAPENRSLNVFHFNSALADQVEELGRMFEAYSGIKVETEIYASDHFTVLTSRDAAGNLPDIFDTGSYGERALQRWYENGKIQPVQDLAIFDALDPVFVEGLRSADGNIYLVPKGAQASGILYNMDIFEQAGITSAPQTLDELVDAVEKIEALGVTPFGNATADAWIPGTCVWSPGLQMLGTDEWMERRWATGEGSFADFADPVVDVLDLMIQHGNSRPMEVDYIGHASLMATGEVAMIAHGNWIVGDIVELNPELDGRIGVFPIPFSNDKAVNNLYLFSNFYLVSADADFDAVDKYFSYAYLSEEGVAYFQEAFQELNPYGIQFDGNTADAQALALVNAGRAVANQFTQDKPDGFWQSEGSILQEYYGGQIDRASLFAAMDAAWED